MQGELVRKSIKAAGWTIGRVAENIGISREYLGKLLSSEIESAYVDKIQKLGIEILDLKKYEQKRSDPSPETWDRALDIIDRALKMLEKHDELHVKLIDKGIDEGIIVFKDGKHTYAKT